MKKLIHYCWFGGNPLPEKEKKCMESWKKFFPDYEIKRWDETNFNINICQYVRESYDAHNWAFVSDFARVWILYNFGGIYFDTDVEIIKPMDDIIARGAFIGRERTAPFYGVNPGLCMSCDAGLEFCKELLESYYHSTLIQKDGTMSFYSIPERVTDLLLLHGLSNEDKVQKVAGLYIYPKEYFCPLDYYTGKLDITKNSYSIHWFTASWLDKRMKKQQEVCRKIRIFSPTFASEKVCSIYLYSCKFFEYLFQGKIDIIINKIIMKIKLK